YHEAMKKSIFMVLVSFLLSLPASAAGGGIQWYGTWEQGVAAARASNRPILLVSGAPACRSVPGIW
ncbi:MAG: thioredoxin family protein, partial [Candidatus Xenobia bacterium]